MTYEEAKRIINSDIVNYDKLLEARTIAIDCIEKQIPKKPTPYYDSEYKCPNCGELVNLSSGYKQPYCFDCGQAIDWSDVE